MKPIIAVPVTIALVYRAYSRKSLTPLGIVVASFIAVIHALHPWSAPFACLVVFFLGGTGVTKVKHEFKSHLTLSASGSSGGGEGARTHIQVLANSAVASVLIALHTWQLYARRDEGNDGCWSYKGDLLVVGIVVNYASVAADTFSSELGILSRSPPRLLTSPPTFPRVPPGTNGGVTPVGICAGVLGAWTIAVTAGLLLPWCTGGNDAQGPGEGEGESGIAAIRWPTMQKVGFVAFATVWGALGSLVDSALGGMLQASVVDTRTGKVVEGSGGRKVLITPSTSSSSSSSSSSSHHGSSTATSTSSQPRPSGLRERPVDVDVNVKDDEFDSARPSTSGSRVLATGRDVLDNNAVNFLMALIMSVGGMAVMAWFWDVILPPIFLKVF